MNDHFASFSRDNTLTNIPSIFIYDYVYLI